MKGIYKIENLINGKCYVGQSDDIEKRFKQHKKTAKYGTPETLYEDMRKYGAENFGLSVLELSDDNLDELERYYIEKCNAFYLDGGYNMTKGGKGKQGYKTTEDTRTKISKSHTGLHGGGNNPSAERVVCDGTVFGCIKECADHYGVPYTTMKSWVFRKRLPKLFYTKGFHLENEDFSMYSVQGGKVRGKEHHFTGTDKSGKKNPHSKKVICDGVVFDCMKDCAMYYGVSNTYLSSILGGKINMPKRFQKMGLRYIETTEPSTAIERVSGNRE